MAAPAQADGLKIKNIKTLSKLIIIVAGGSGTRMGSSVPKQFLPLRGRPVLMRTIEAFAAVGGMRVVLVLPASQVETWRGLCGEYCFTAECDVALGGSTRHESVSNGLKLWRGEDLIGVHDGVRPIVSAEFIDRLYAEAGTFGSAIPVLPSVESVRIAEPDGTSRAMDRSKVMMVQTPQVFRSSVLLEAYGQPYSPLFTDDASVVEAAGVSVHLSEGFRGNIKLTTPADMAVAEALLPMVGGRG